MDFSKFLSLADEVIQNHISDLHLSSDQYPYIRNKTGDISPVEAYGILSDADVNEIAAKILGHKFEENTVDIGFAHNDHRFRVNISRTINGTSIAFRTILSDIPEPKDIMLPNSILEATHANK